ncbi:reverse transcriptase domain-containing protein [Tanacetum coccineum]
MCRIGCFRKSRTRLRKICRCLLDIPCKCMVTKPKTMQDAIEFATELMDKKISTFAERQAENKKETDNNNQARTTTSQGGKCGSSFTQLGLGEIERVCWNSTTVQQVQVLYHNGPCTVKCANCKRVGHLTRDCWSYAATNNHPSLAMNVGIKGTIGVIARS